MKKQHNLDFTFICENAGVPKLKRIPRARLSRFKNPRIVNVGDGVKLEAELTYRQGDWTLCSVGGMYQVFPESALPRLLELSRLMGG